jgi:hypothetical protein
MNGVGGHRTCRWLGYDINYAVGNVLLALRGTVIVFLLLQ